jgi:hypothetical protein
VTKQEIKGGYEKWQQNFRTQGEPGILKRITVKEKGVEMMADPAKKSIRKKTTDDEIKTSLMDKYRETFIEKLTPQDLEELQLYRRKQYDKVSGWNSEYKQKFEFKLRQYFHEEVLMREIPSIEILLGLLQPHDLKI